MDAETQRKLIPAWFASKVGVAGFAKPRSCLVEAWNVMCDMCALQAEKGGETKAAAAAAP